MENASLVPNVPVSDTDGEVKPVIIGLLTEPSPWPSWTIFSDKEPHYLIEQFVRDAVGIKIDQHCSDADYEYNEYFVSDDYDIDTIRFELDDALEDETWEYIK